MILILGTKFYLLIYIYMTQYIIIALSFIIVLLIISIFSMVWDPTEISKLEEKNKALKEEIQNIEIKNQKFFNEETVKIKIENEKLLEKITNLSDSRELARRELNNEYEKHFEKSKEEVQRIYDDRLNQIEQNYFNKINTEVEIRVNEAVWEVRLTNKELARELESTKKWSDMYQKKAENWKIELWADEVKGILLSANPNWQKILEWMKNM